MTSPLVQRFSRNTTGRDLIVGDIHGYFTKLQAALDAVGFSPASGDRLFSVGDLVDRGPESHRCIEWLDQPWFHAVSGNHEDMAIWWPTGTLEAGQYMQNGGAWNIGNLPEHRTLYAETFRALPVAMELETDQGLVGIVHAECPAPSWQEFTSALESPDTPEMARMHLVAMAQWMRNRIESIDMGDVAGVRAVVVGHTPVQQYTSLGNTIYIDTGAWLPGDRAREFCLLDAKTLRPVDPPSKLQW